MAETTGGSGAGSGGGSAGGSQVEGLAINFSAPGAQETASATDKVAASVDTFGKVTVRSRLNLEDLIAAGAKFTTQQLEELNAVNASVQAVQNKAKAEAEALRFAQARTDEGQRYLVQLNEMITLHGKTTAELQSYKAAQLGVSDSAAAMIAQLEKLNTVQQQNSIQQKRDIDAYNEQGAAYQNQQRIQEQRDVWEHEQRAKAYNDYISWWDKTLEAQSANDAKMEAEARKHAENIKRIEQERDVWLNNERQRAQSEYIAWWDKTLKAEEDAHNRSVAASRQEAEQQKQIMQQQDVWMHGERTRIANEKAQEAADAAKAKETTLKRELDLDIAYGEKSLKAQIATLEKIKAYQNDSRSGPAGVNLSSMFGPKAVSEVEQLEQKIKLFNDTLGHHGKKLGEVGEATSLWGKIMDNNRIRTEGIVLAHEALQGRFTRMPGSLMVMTEYLTAANIPIVGMLGGVLGLAAAFVGLAYEMGKGQAQFKELAGAVERTNGWAGETAGGFDVLAHSVGQAHGNFTEAYESITALTRSGKFTADQIRDITTATVDLNHTMGVDINQTIKEFETLAVRSTSNSSKGMLEVAVAVEKLDQKYHFLNATELEHIIMLEKEGKTIEASQEAVRLFSEETERAAKANEDNVGWIEQGWKGFLGVLHQVGQAMADIGKKSLEIRAMKMSEAMSSMFPKDRNHPELGFQDDESKLSSGEIAMLHDYYNLQEQIAAQGSKTAEKAENRRAQSEADHVLMQRAIQDRTLMKKTVNELDDALQTNSQQLTKVIAADPTYLDDPKNQQYEDDRMEAIIKAHTKKVSGIKDDGRKQDLQNQLNADQAAYDLLLEANKHDIDTLKQLADQKQITRQQEYDGITAAYNDELQALQVMEAAKIATLEAYKAKSKADAEETKKRLADVRRDYALTALAIQDAKEKEQQAIVGKAVKEVETQDKKEINSLDEKIKAQEKFNLEYGKTEAEKKKANALLDEEILKTMKLDLVKSNMIANDPNAKPADKAAAAQHVKDLTTEIEKQEKLIEVTKEGRRIAEGSDAIKALNKYLDPASAKSFGDEFAGAFGKAGKSVANFITVLEKMRKEQAQNQDQQTNNAKAYLNDAEDAATYEKNRATINERNTHQQLAGYSAMAASAASFFGEHSRGYQVLNAVSQAFHMAELAMNLASIAPAMAAGAAQFFAQSGWGGFAGVAAMGAVIAGFGIATSGGGGGGMSAKDRQAANGTGSVFGDDKAKSDSISKSIKMVEENTYDGLSISSSMLVQLQSINAGINGLGTLLYRTDGFTTKTAETQKGFGDALGTSKTMAVVGGGAVGMIAVMADKLLGGKLSQISGKIGNAIFGGNVHSLDTGITMGSQTVGQIGSTGVNINQYTDTKKDGGLFSKDKYNTSLVSLGSQTNDQFTKIIQGMTNTIKIEAGMLGLNSDSFTAKLNSFVVSIGKISTKDMSAEDVQKALQNALSKVADDMANFSVEGLQKFQNAGEGAFETLTRIATEYETVDVVMQSFGRTFGTVGTGSLAARDNLVQLAGGLDKFTSQADYVLKNFYTDQEQAEALKKRLQPTLTKYNLSTEGANANIAFRDLIKSLDLTTTYGAEAYTELMQIAPAFKQITDANKDELDSLKAVADERKNLQDQLDDLTMTEMQKADKERSALNEANRGLYDQIQIAKKVKEAQDAAKNSLTSFISQMKSFATTAAGLNKGLIVGSLSNLTPEQQYAQARKQFEETRAKAYKGDSTAQGELSSVEQTFLQLSQKLNGGDAAYSSDLATVMRTNDDLSKWAINSTDIAQASLDALNNTSATLDDISKTLTLIAQGGQLTPDLTGPSNAPLVSMSGLNYASYGTLDMLPLVNEVKALRAEVAGLRADQQVQTGDLINTSVGNAQVIVEGVKDALVDEAWSANNTVRTIK